MADQDRNLCLVFNERVLNMHVFQKSILVPADLNDVFHFFNTPKNLSKLMPAYFNFQLLTPDPIVMKESAVFDYKLRLLGVPMRWSSMIVDYEKPHRFVDIQLKGPHSYWHHEHRFESVDGGTLITDTIHYEFPLFSSLANLLIGKPMNEILFRHRESKINELLPSIKGHNN